MSTFFELINSPEDLKKLHIDDLPSLCEEIRKYLLSTILNSGGHLASNLGVVELSVALHYVFDSPVDKICWDVGHQSYIHKLLTGRKKRLSTIRHFKGLSGFPKNSESEHDHYSTGHAGTSISQAIGEVFARDKNKENFSVVSVIGDASISTGMAFEALNHAGALQKPFLVILNDNEMSISQSVGAFHHMLNMIHNIKRYKSCKKDLSYFFERLPIFGNFFCKIFSLFNKKIKSTVYNTSLFEHLGFQYLGPENGHNIKNLVRILQSLKDIDSPTILHLITQKGKGFSPAEQDPIQFHGVSQGKKLVTHVSLSQIVGETLIALRKNNDKIIVITPAMTIGSGLSSFSQQYAESFLDVGISEQHATTLSGSLAKVGLIPYLCIYSTFLQRALDQLIHDICLMNLPVRIIIDRAGCVGEDGETHQGVYDLSFMYPLPNLSIFSTDNPKILIAFLLLSEFFLSPVAIRIPKKTLEVNIEKEIITAREAINILDIYKPEMLYEGTKAIFFLEGSISSIADDLYKKVLEASNISIRIDVVFCLKPLNQSHISSYLESFSYVFIVEEHVQINGFAVNFFNVFRNQLKDKTFYSFGYPEKPLLHGSIADVKASVGLDIDSIVSKVVSMI